MKIDSDDIAIESRRYLENCRSISDCMNHNTEASCEDWFNRLFLDKPELYLPVLESMRDQSRKEVEGICGILDEFKAANGCKILDFSCGIGRHSVHLAKRGYEIVGCDPSGYFIEKAKAYANQELPTEEPQKLRFYSSTISEFKDKLYSNNEYDFDAIIIMFTSIGYSSENDDIRILKDLFALAKKNCILIMETENRDKTIMNPLIRNIYEFNEVLINEIWNFDQYASVLRSRSKFYQKDKDNQSISLKLDLQMKVRLYSLHELIQILKTAGWKFQRGYGDISGLSDISINSLNLTTVAQKL